MIQSYLDEFMWRFNNSVHNNRIESYVLILKVISKFYAPETELENFEKNYLEANGDQDEEAVIHFVETSDSEDEKSSNNEDDSDVESIFGSLMGSDYGSERVFEFNSDQEQEEVEK
ncbi:unnamed protein product, partial [Brachionus calyciflorus]